MTDAVPHQSDAVAAVFCDESRDRDEQYLDLTAQLDSAEAANIFSVLHTPDDALYFGADSLMDVLAFSATARDRTERAELQWEYWNGDSWGALRVADRWVAPGGEAGSSETRRVSWSAPDDWRPRSIGDAGLQVRDRYWVRTRLVRAAAVVIPWWRSCGGLIGIGAVLTLIVGGVFVLTMFGGGDDETEVPADEPTSIATATSPAASPTGPAPTATEVTVTPDTATPTLEPQPTVDISGRWRLEFVETVAFGVCASEVGERFEWDLVFEHSGSTVLIGGIGGEPDQIWEGSLEGNTLTFSGSYPEDLGITTATFELLVSFEEMTAEGIKFWEWVGASGTCPDGESDATAVRIAGP